MPAFCRDWVTAVSPATAEPLATWLRHVSNELDRTPLVDGAPLVTEAQQAAVAFARMVNACAR